MKRGGNFFSHFPEGTKNGDGWGVGQLSFFIPFLVGVKKMLAAMKIHISVLKMTLSSQLTQRTFF